jgi:beta-lactamase class A
MRISWLLLALPVFVLRAADVHEVNLEREMSRLATVSGGEVGAVAIHIESGRIAALNGAGHFPMASTVKVPVAVQLLSLIDQGEEALDHMITIQPGDLHPGSGTLTPLFNKPGVILSVRNLMELMLLISDNSAADVCMRLARGPKAITNRMQALGFDGIRVDRPTIGLIADIDGVEALPPDSESTPDKIEALLNGVPRLKRRTAYEHFQKDPRDTSTPEAMARLLVSLYRRELLKPQSAELLLDIMHRCQTGAARLKGLLPEGTEVAHKTGTLSGVADDVGIMTLPFGGGHVALAVFVKASDAEPAKRERGIAEIARAVHDYFEFVPGR